MYITGKHKQPINMTQSLLLLVVSGLVGGKRP
jgi:hypothetical protein